MQILHFALSFFVNFHKINKMFFDNIVDSLGFSFPAWPRRHAGYPPAGGYGFA